ncbi:DUF3164 family protein [Polaribacter undariae]|uniref:DUF3164 family protein n=1 Tax=Polaribacter sejongensis TaxID=985043 RepID=A0AAJ1VHX8_9FLAO|nr:DUF3164 family protein [Polaribacter undariae]MDN3621313.1 DUF3164 family protein [Polaribacter undariae]UWD31855.1 DUF3164 family protein [Polaribacter undariae]
MAIDISKLTPAEKAELHQQFAADAKAEAEKLKQNKATYKELAEEFVLKSIDALVHHKEITEYLLTDTMKEFQAVKELKQEVYGVKNQDSHTVTLKDGSASISLGQNVIIRFDGTESAGVEKIKEYLLSLSADSENAKKLGKVIDRKLKVNKTTGFLNPSAIIDLNTFRDEFNNELFSDGLDIIINAQIRTVNSKYVSGWKFIPIDENRTKKLEFRFTI